MAVPILQIQATNTTPHVDFDAITGTLCLSGRSIHPDPVVFYKQIIEWLEGYIEEPCHKTTLDITFEYINSSSLIHLSQIFIKMQELENHGHFVKVTWIYEDEDIKELGEDYAELVEIPFILQVKK